MWQWEYLLWIGIFLAALIAEGLTMQIISIWFAVGALVALIISLCGGSLALQCAAFVIVSAALFIATRPLIKKWNAKPKQHTNADSVIGMEGIVKETIDPLLGTGRVYVNGLNWAARADGIIPEHTRITVLSMQGVTLMVRPSETSE